MNNTIDISDFTGRFSLSTGQYRADQFNAYVKEKQQDYLVCFLGVDLYRELETYFDGGETPTEDRWNNFLNGADYTSDATSYTEIFEGFKSLLVKLVYSSWIVDSKYYFNETGAFEPENENSKKSGERFLQRKSFNAHNEAVSDIYRLYDFLYTNQTGYPDFEEHFRYLQFRGSTKITLQ